MYIIGDVHGCIKTLEKLLEKIPSNEKICFVGDIIDRGENSKEVIELIKSNNYDCIRGNHEEYMIETMEVLFDNPEYINQSVWVNRLGGDKALESYGGFETINENKLFKEHLEWLKQLPLYIEYEDLKTKDGRYLVVSHACANDKWKFRKSHVDSFNYQEFYQEVMKSRKIGTFDNKEIFNVFGHTPQEKLNMKEHYAAIDLGCVYGKSLCALHFPSLEVVIQEYVG